MPLASPSSLTSNTLATFLDHVPISTNNAEKWKPKQMGSNSGGDYWALSRALSAPLGLERWIPHHLFLSIATKVRGEKTVAVIQYVYMSQKHLWRGSNGHLLLDTRGMKVRNCTWTFLGIVTFLCFYLSQYFVYYQCTPLSEQCPNVCITSFEVFQKISFPLWYQYNNSQPRLIHLCWTLSMQTMPHTVAAVFCAADWHNKAMHRCEGMLGYLALTPLYGQNHSIVYHLIMHKPSRLKEYVSDTG